MFWREHAASILQKGANVYEPWVYKREALLAGTRSHVCRCWLLPLLNCLNEDLSTDWSLQRIGFKDRFSTCL
jgi:hypothetical protein